MREMTDLFNRMERLEGQLGIPLPATTQWELMAASAKLLRALTAPVIANSRTSTTPLVPVSLGPQTAVVE